MTQANKEDFLGRAMKVFSSACLVILGVVLMGVVGIRTFPVANLSWSDEIVEWCFSWMVFMGTAAIWKDNSHFRLEFLLNVVHGRLKRCLEAVIEVANIAFMGVFTYFGFILTWRASDRSPILEWPRPVWYVCIPLSGAIMLYYSLKRMAGHFRGSAEPANGDPTPDQAALPPEAR